MKKLKILYEGLSSNLGGIEVFVHNLVENMNLDEFEVYILLDKNVKTAFHDEYIKKGIHFVYTTNRKNNYFQYIKDLKEIYIYNKFDIIHINVMSYSLFERITLACKYSNSKIIVHSHNGGYTSKLYRTRFLHKIGKFMIRKCNFLKVACGEKAGKFMFDNDEFTIFNNGINIDKYKYNDEDRIKKRHELNISEDDFVIGLIAAFLEVKNHKFLIDFYEEYLKLNKKSKLILIGEGPLEDKIKLYSKEKNISDKILFLGKKNDANKYYSCFDTYIMPSFSEGLSISLVEAQVNGLKCYTTDGVDKNSNISGNVEFLSLDSSAEDWAKIIYFDKKYRDKNVLDKIPDDFKSNFSYKKICDYYFSNSKG